MSQIRSTANVTVRTPVALRSGTFDDGRSWAVREVEVLDEDQNKVTLRVIDGLELATGPTHITIDSFLKGTNKAGQVHIVAAKAARQG